ncbi:Uncharacterized protein SCF082_LOCUS17341, partial [Durusdinium trenchii]
MTLQAQTQPDAKTLSDLTAEGAPLAAGALPDLQTVGADGSKGVWTAMGSTLSISLQAVEYGGELTKQLLDESKKMEKLFTNYTDLVKRKVTDDSKYDSAADQAAAKSLLAGLNKKAPKKKAAKKEKVVTNSTELEDVWVPAILPHELLHALAKSGLESQCLAGEAVVQRKICGITVSSFPNGKTIQLSVVTSRGTTRKETVQKDVYRLVSKLLAWSLKHAAAGRFPMTGFANEEFDPKTLRGALKGQVLAQ